jgi:hypothetical protein
MTTLRRENGIVNSNADQRKEHERELDARARQIATRLARGNVSLQNGCFESEEDLARVRRVFATYEF